MHLDEHVEGIDAEYGGGGGGGKHGETVRCGVPITVIGSARARSCDRMGFTVLARVWVAQLSAVRPSMGSRGDAYVNAMAEDFSSTLECECLAKYRFILHAHARLVLVRYIEGWDNPHRRLTSQPLGSAETGQVHVHSICGGIRRASTIYRRSPWLPARSRWPCRGRSARSFFSSLEPLTTTPYPYTVRATVRGTDTEGIPGRKRWRLLQHEHIWISRQTSGLNRGFRGFSSGMQRRSLGPKERASPSTSWPSWPNGWPMTLSRPRTSI